MAERGTYRNVERGRQLVRFDGMQYGNITPTDIDGMMELHGKGNIYYEVKEKGAEFPTGQRILFERTFRDYMALKKHCLILIADHEVYDVRQSIYLNYARVRSFLSSCTPGSLVDGKAIWQEVKPRLKNGQYSAVGNMTYHFIKNCMPELIGEAEEEQHRKLNMMLKRQRWNEYELPDASEQKMLEVIKSKSPFLFGMMKNGTIYSDALSVFYEPNNELTERIVKIHKDEISDIVNRYFDRGFVMNQTKPDASVLTG